MNGPILEQVRKDGLKKPVETPEKPKVTPYTKKTDTIHEALRKIREQIEAIPILDLAVIQEQNEDIKKGIDTLIGIMERKVELDEKEAVVLDLLRDKMQKAT